MQGKNYIYTNIQELYVLYYTSTKYQLMKQNKYQWTKQASRRTN